MNLKPACLAVHLGLDFRSTSWTECHANHIQVECHMWLCLATTPALQRFITWWLSHFLSPFLRRQLIRPWLGTSWTTQPTLLPSSRKIEQSQNARCTPELTLLRRSSLLAHLWHLFEIFPSWVFWAWTLNISNHEFIPVTYDSIDLWRIDLLLK